MIEPELAPAVSRRKFLARTAVGGMLLSAAPMYGGGGLQAMTAATRAPAPRRTLPIGIELYAVRAELARDLPLTLRTVRQIGYEAVEFYAPYLEWTLPYAKTVRTMLDDLGLRCLSTHNGPGSLTSGAQMPKAIEINQILGTRHLIVASPPFERATGDDWKRLGAQLTTAAEVLAPHGLLAGYHNHDAEWAAVTGGQRGMDILAATTPPEVVLQLDVGTCVMAGADPVAWIRANPGRIRSVHLKDWAPGAESAEKGYRVLFGEGAAPWRQILDAAESVGGVELYLMEQEGSRFSEFETARRCLATWRAMHRTR